MLPLPQHKQHRPSPASFTAAISYVVVSYVPDLPSNLSLFVVTNLVSPFILVPPTADENSDLVMTWFLRH